MDSVPKWVQRTAAAVGILVGATALVTFVIGYSSTKNDLDRTNRELVAEKERNRRAFDLLKSATSEGRIGETELVKYLSEDDSNRIVQAAGIRVDQSLPLRLDTQFFPSGWMGDGESGTQFLSLTRRTMPIGSRSVVVIDIQYRQGPKGWAGIYWQFPDGNWGNMPGKALVGARELTFRVRGERGGEIVEFKSGGVRGKRYADSFEVSLGPVVLTKEWTSQRIDLSKADLSSVIGAFAWSASAAENSGQLRFYLSDLEIK